jgi:hypothetical protein
MPDIQKIRNGLNMCHTQERRETYTLLAGKAEGKSFW